jgi:multidrug efflux system membrane fusion protein
MNTVFSKLLVALTVFSLITACSEPGENQDAQAPQGAMPPPPPVTVAQVIQKEVSDWKEYTGRLEASDSIVVMPRTSGYVVSVGFEDGAHVKKGDLLFQIDYRTVRAEVQRLTAEVTRSEAEIELSERDLKRAESLRKKNAISQEQLDNSRTRLTQAIAAAESAKADLRRTKVLDAITTVKAEFDGQVSNARVKVGSSVIAGNTVLTTLVSTDKTHAYFDVDEKTFARLQALGNGKRLDEMNIPVFMGLAGEANYPHQGVIDFVDNQVDIATGTIRLRAVFSNEAGKFTPGMFARVKMQIGENYQGTLVDEKAIVTDLSHKYVLVLGENNILQYRPVQLGAKFEGMRIILSGLSAGEKIVVKGQGLPNVFPGMPVAPTEAEMAPADSDPKSQG